MAQVLPYISRCCSVIAVSNLFLVGLFDRKVWKHFRSQNVLPPFTLFLLPVTGFPQDWHGVDRNLRMLS
jgi:hypothetical protein